MPSSAMKRGFAATVLTVAAVGALLAVGAARAHVDDGPGDQFDLESMSRRADLVFAGQVLEVSYRNSEPGGATNAVDGSDLPHTYVTFLVEEVFKGKVEGRQVVLRFLGGINGGAPTGAIPEEEGPATEIFASSLTPLFDVGDRDLLFVQDNTVSGCPLVNCADGRFRFLSASRARADSFVYTDRGEELRKSGNRTILGPPQPLPAVLVNQIGPFSVRAVPDEGTDGDAIAGAVFASNIVIGKQITEKAFGDDVARAVRRAHTREELANLRPIPNADPTEPFTAGALRTVAVEEPIEEVRPLERPWLDDLSREERAALEAAESAEEAAFEAAGGNPVLPPTRP